MRFPSPSTLACLSLLGCGSAPDSAHKPIAAQPASARTRELDKSTWAKLKRFEQLYRQPPAPSDAAGDAARDQELAQLRIELCSDKNSSFWLARLFVRDSIVALDQGLATVADFVEVATSPQNRILDRAVAQLVAMGPHGVPCVTEDLLLHPHSDRKELGVRLLQAIGPVVLLEVAPLADAADPAVRRAAIETLSSMQEEEQAKLAISKAAGDSHFAVRGAAYAALARRGDTALDQLLKALAEDQDPYVRRTIAKELGRSRDPRARAALLDYRVRCVQQKDSRGIEAADEALAVGGQK